MLSWHPQLQSLHGQPDTVISTPVIPEHWLKARQRQQLADRPWRLAQHLFSGCFYGEALKSWREAFESLLIAVAWRQGLGEQVAGEELSIEQIQQLITQQVLPPSAITLTHFLRENTQWTEDQLKVTWQESQILMRSLREEI